MRALPLLDASTPGKPREECGVVAVYTPDQNRAACHAYWGLHALQHRGQEAAGIAAQLDGEIVVHKDVGLVNHVFKKGPLDKLASNRAIGHVRYSTTGQPHKKNAQPLVAAGKRTAAIAHNGNLVNAQHLKAELEAEGYHFTTSTDSEVIAALLATRSSSANQALRDAMGVMEGAYAVVVLCEGKLLCCRDRHGIRPLVLGMLDGDFVVASETCALDILGASYLRDVVPGEMLVISEQGLESAQVHEPTPRPCSFEAIYFARPDSRLGLETVYDVRLRLGRELARDYPVEADIVIGVPDSGHTMAAGYATESGIPFVDGFIKNRYVARTFIEPTPEEREIALRKKFNPMPTVIAGNRVVVVDDSLVRGNTTRMIIDQLRRAGAVEVHMRISSPPTRYPCYYGIDMGRDGDYIAVRDDGSKRPAEEIAELIGADSLHFLTAEGLARALRRPLAQRCTACFTGDYPTPLPGQGLDKNALEDQSV